MSNILLTLLLLFGETLYSLWLDNKLAEIIGLNNDFLFSRN